MGPALFWCRGWPCRADSRRAPALRCGLISLGIPLHLWPYGKRCPHPSWIRTSFVQRHSFPLAAARAAFCDRAVWPPTGGERLLVSAANNVVPLLCLAPLFCKLRQQRCLHDLQPGDPRGNSIDKQGRGLVCTVLCDIAKARASE